MIILAFAVLLRKTHHIVLPITRMEHVAMHHAVLELLKNIIILTFAVLLKMKYHIVLAITRKEHVLSIGVVQEQLDK